MRWRGVYASRYTREGSCLARGGLGGGSTLEVRRADT